MPTAFGWVRIYDWYVYECVCSHALVAVEESKGTPDEAHAVQ